ncbi:caseinolytic peptidase B protein homolog [Paramacrobiotus metropolitanus]|uniref:caseinolytic peptidase B protein homolog n=1 Tax=Paramacrobiotus metropolitanus TaxID=2943436 RepID=UPI0024457480|nr:caseinolytic peptidase B protein homolog [Paramacrobiotus metropolitanus]
MDKLVVTLMRSQIFYHHHQQRLRLCTVHIVRPVSKLFLTRGGYASAFKHVIPRLKGETDDSRWYKKLKKTLTILKYGLAFSGIVYAHCSSSRNNGNAPKDPSLPASSECALFRCCKSPRSLPETAALLQDETLNINTVHPLGWTFLHVSAANGNAAATRLLLEAGADPNAQDEFNNVYAVSEARKSQPMEILLIREEDFSGGLNTRASFKGCTALHYAALADDLETVQLLLQAGGNPLIINEKGHTCLEYAKEPRIKEMLEQAVARGEEFQRRCEAEERSKFPLEERLKQTLVGQETAIATVSAAIRRRESGWYDDDHPLVLLFLGSSGIGKTELAKQIALYLNKDQKKGFIRLDMSEYQEKHEVSKLIGSPPGYLGHEQGGQLTQKLKESPGAVVLFDEVDKAHPDVLTVLLQLFDEGRLTDGRGKTVECKEAIFIMTSNLATDEIAEFAVRMRQEDQAMRGAASDLRPSSEVIHFPRKFKDEVVEPKLKRHFRRDEFLGRINEIVYFVPFSHGELLQLVDKDLTFWKDRARRKHDVQLEWDAGLVEAIADGYNIHYGARSIRHEIERSVINPLAAAYERHLLNRQCCVRLTADTSLSLQNDAGECLCEPRPIKILLKPQTQQDNQEKKADFVDITESLKQPLPQIAAE